MTWWTDYQTRRGGSRKDLYSNNMKNVISNKIESSTSYELVTINNISRKTRIVEESSIERNPNRKRLLCYPNETIDIGDIVFWDNLYWICIMNDTGLIDVGIIQKCNNTLSYYTSDSILHSIPCIISDNISLDNEINKYITVVDNEIYCFISDDVTNRQIDVNDIFSIGYSNYYVMTKPDDISNLGLIRLKMKYSEVEQSICTYTIEILNGTSIRADINNTLQLNVRVNATIDGITTIVSPTPSLIFNSSNDNICTVDSTGLCTFHSVSESSWDLDAIIDDEMILDLNKTYELTEDDSFLLSDLFGVDAIPGVIVSVKLASDESVIDYINIDVYEAVQDNYTYSLVGSLLPDTEIKTGSTKVFTAHKFNNGVEIINAKFNFSIIAGTTPSTVYTFTTINDYSCNIKSNLYTYYITLRATDVLDNTEYIEKIIKLRSVM